VLLFSLSLHALQQPLFRGSRPVRWQLSQALVLGLLVLGSGCIATVPHGTPEVLAAGAKHFPGLTEIEVEEDRAMFLEHCTGCHLLPTGNQLPIEEWPAALDEMNLDLELDEKQMAHILRYLQLSRLYWDSERARIEAERQQRRERRNSSAATTPRQNAALQAP